MTPSRLIAEWRMRALGCAAMHLHPQAKILATCADELDAALRDFQGEQPRMTIVEVQGHAGKPVAAPCCIDGCQYSKLAVERGTAPQRELSHERTRKVELGLRLGQILGPDYDGVSLEDIARELVALKSKSKIGERGTVPQETHETDNARPSGALKTEEGSASRPLSRID
jgi:hypothetical protein